MKALDEHILMALFVLMLKRVSFLALFVCLIWTEKRGSGRVEQKIIGFYYRVNITDTFSFGDLLWSLEKQ